MKKIRLYSFAAAIKDGMIGVRNVLGEDDLKRQLKADREHRENVGTFKLVECIGKITIRKNTPSTITSGLMGSAPHTLIIKD